MFQTVGPDGDLWYTQQGDATGRVGRYDRATEQVTEYQLPPMPAGGYGGGIISAPDGGIWVTGPEALVRIDAALGTITQVPLAPGSAPGFFALDGGRGLWFSDVGRGSIGHLTFATGAVVEYRSGFPAGAKPHALAVGPDRAVWFVLARDAAVGRLDPRTGVVTLYRIGAPDPGFLVTDLVVGPDRGLWYPTNNGLVVRFDLGTHRFSTWSFSTSVMGMAVGPDRAVWFTLACDEHALRRVDGRGRSISQFATPGAVATTVNSGLLRTADGHLWYQRGKGLGLTEAVVTTPRVR